MGPIQKPVGPRCTSPASTAVGRFGISYGTRQLEATHISGDHMEIQWVSTPHIRRELCEKTIGEVPELIDIRVVLLQKHHHVCWYPEKVHVLSKLGKLHLLCRLSRYWCW